MPTTTFSELNAAKMRSVALKDLGKLGLIMFGLGAGARGVQGLAGLGRRNFQEREEPDLLTRRTIDIPIASPEEKEKFAYSKSAEKAWYEGITEPFGRAFAGDVKSPTAIPWFMPAAVFGSGAAAYGGHRLADMVMDARRKSEQKARLEEAKAEYERALLGQSKLGEDLNELCDAVMEKQSISISPDTAGHIAGGGLTLAGLLALGSGLLTYDMAKGKRPEEILRAAKARRARDRYARTPQPLFAQPVSAAPSEDEMAGAPLDKVAEDTQAPSPPQLPNMPKSPTAPPPIAPIKPRK